MYGKDYIMGHLHVHLCAASPCSLPGIWYALIRTSGEGVFHYKKGKKFHRRDLDGRIGGEVQAQIDK
jgi:hypothetical protein